jgi:hypothetical protein
MDYGVTIAINTRTIRNPAFAVPGEESKDIPLLFRYSEVSSQNSE